MNAEFNWWLLILGAVTGAGLVFTLLAATGWSGPPEETDDWGEEPGGTWFDAASAPLPRVGADVGSPPEPDSGGDGHR